MASPVLQNVILLQLLLSSNVPYFTAHLSKGAVQPRCTGWYTDQDKELGSSRDHSLEEPTTTSTHREQSSQALVTMQERVVLQEVILATVPTQLQLRAEAVPGAHRLRLPNRPEDSI